MPDTVRDRLASDFVRQIKARFPKVAAAAAMQLALGLVDSVQPAALELLNTRENIKRADSYRDAQEASTDPLARELIQQMRDQLLIALIIRAGGSITVPVDEIDATGGTVLTMRVDERAFVFAVEKSN